jgi:hypothetical protein
MLGFASLTHNLFSIRFSLLSFSHGLSAKGSTHRSGLGSFFTWGGGNDGLPFGDGLGEISG